MAQMIQSALEKESFFVDLAHDGYIGKKMAIEKKYDAIILDVNLPLINGFDVCREIRKSNLRTPIIMLTAMGTMEDKLTGFDVGADDYILKPFEFKELLARLNVFLKRSNTYVEKEIVLKIADLEMNLNNKTVKRAGRLIPLSVKEFALLEVLIKNKGKVVSKADLADKVWEISFKSGTNVIEVYVNYLRKKIDKDYPVKLIHTMVGMGYILKED